MCFMLCIKNDGINNIVATGVGASIIRFLCKIIM